MCVHALPCVGWRHDSTPPLTISPPPPYDIPVFLVLLIKVSVSVLQPGYIQSQIFAKHERTQDPLSSECERAYGHLYDWDVRTPYPHPSSVHGRDTNGGKEAPSLASSEGRSPAIPSHLIT